MSDPAYRDPLQPDDDREAVRRGDPSLAVPEDLPPVEPPSAGMIVQLFLVPAVIVAVIVGVYVLFGQLASQEMDWRQLVTDVRSENPHVRWRGALGLAQMLDADAQRTDSSQNLKSNPDIAAALADLYGKLIHVSNPREDELKQIEFLSKALGRMDVAEVIAAILLDPGPYVGRVLELTGARSVDLYELADEYSAALGRRVRRRLWQESG
jgi:hypothetical protein